MRLERDLEHYARCFIAETRLGQMRKFISPGRRGAPDNLALWTSGVCDFLEFKQPGKRPDRHQVAWHRDLRALGFTVLVLDTKEQVDDYVRTRCAERLHATRVPDAGA